MPEAGWEHYDHPADVGLRAWGPDLASALAEAGRALTAVITNPEGVAAQDPVPIRCSGKDPELLLVDWLDAIIFEMGTRGMLFARFDVRVDKTGIEATAWGEPVAVDRHQPAVEIKGATLTDLAAEHIADSGWWLQCVVDV